ncbi:MAG: kdpB 1 [Firmicutes bacterium]|nr:kdpB 1 [Bacillota bacterium]
MVANSRCGGECKCHSKVESANLPACGTADIAGAEVVLVISGLDCADCAAKLEKSVSRVQGVLSAKLNFAVGRLNVSYDDAKVKPSDIIGVITSLGYQAEILDKFVGTGKLLTPWWLEKRQMATGVAGVLIISAYLLEWLGVTGGSIVCLYAVAAGAGGYHAARAGLNSLRYLTPDMNFLMTVAVLGAFAIGESSEGAMVAFLFAVGNTLQMYTMNKTRQSIRMLMEVAPPDALVKRAGAETRLVVEDIIVGDTLVVKPGERIAMDGIITVGSSMVNEAAITGEAMPVDKTVGQVVYAGTVNGNGVIEVIVTKLAKDSTLTRIMELVEEAQATKAPSQQFVDTFAKYYTPVVLVTALAVMTLPTIVWQQPFNPWFYKGLVLLVISCPCALVISTPVSIVAAIGNASRQGVLIKGGIYLEQMGAIKAMAFDKTGTLTIGRPEVTTVVPLAEANEAEILALAAGVERLSEHPLAKAVLEKNNYNTKYLGQNFQALPGKGAKADIDGQMVYVGNSQLFNELGHDQEKYSQSVSQLEETGHTVMLVGTQTSLYGLIAVADTIRPNTERALNRLKQAGIRQLVMLTGDNPRAAKNIANQVGIDDFFGQLLPEDKVGAVNKLGGQYGAVAMVGDGINDAPALAAADIGIAMGLGGTDAALETADVVLMADDLDKLAYVVDLGRKTVKIIKQNVYFAVILKLVFLGLTFIGMASLWLAVVADTGAAVLVILNGMRLMQRL